LDLEDPTTRDLVDAGELDPARGEIACVLRKRRAGDAWPERSVTLRNRHSPFGPFVGRTPDELEAFAVALGSTHAVPYHEARGAMRLLVPPRDREPKQEVTFAVRNLLLSEGPFSRDERETYANAFERGRRGATPKGHGSRVVGLAVLRADVSRDMLWPTLGRLYSLRDLTGLAEFRGAASRAVGVDIPYRRLEPRERTRYLQDEAGETRRVARARFGGESGLHDEEATMTRLQAKRLRK